MNRFFNCISIIFHPIIVTTIGIALIVNWLLLSSTTSSLWLLYSLTVSYTIAMPLGIIMLGKSIGIIKSIWANERRERQFCLVITIICLCFFDNVIKQWNTFGTVHTFIYGSIALMAMAFIINFFWHISLHAIGWGGLTALVSYFSLYLPKLSLILGLVIVLSGLVGTARLYVKSHTPAQVFVGYAVGFVIIWSSFLLSTILH